MVYTSYTQKGGLYFLYYTQKGGLYFLYPKKAALAAFCIIHIDLSKGQSDECHYKSCSYCLDATDGIF